MRLLRKLRSTTSYSATLCYATLYFVTGTLAIVAGCSSSESPSTASRPTQTNANESDSLNPPIDNLAASNIPATSSSGSTKDTFPEERNVSRSKIIAERPRNVVLSDTYRPRILLSEQHASTCLRKTGDSLLDLQFADATTGLSTSLKPHLGERLTVVVFCDLSFEISTEQFLRLQKEVLSNYGKTGVSAVAIQVGPAEIADEFSRNSPPQLLVDTGDAYKKVSSMKPPRTFLLDAEGRIVWFDIEYSRGMRAELDNAIRFHLKQLFDTAFLDDPADWHQRFVAKYR